MQSGWTDCGVEEINSYESVIDLEYFEVSAARTKIEEHNSRKTLRRGEGGRIFAV